MLDEAGLPARLPPDLAVLPAAIAASSEAILITSGDVDEPGPRIA